MNLQEVLNDPKWLDHKIGDFYFMDKKPDLWKIAYYPILADGKTGEIYNEPRALIEKPIEGGIDFREIPLRYLAKVGCDVICESSNLISAGI